MADVYNPQLMVSQSGLMRDGTLFSSKSYTELDWCRMHLGRPRKMRGYFELSNQVNGIARAIGTDTFDERTFVHIGTQDQLVQCQINHKTGHVSGLIDRTPAGFAPGPNINWQFTAMVDTPTTLNFLFAHAAPNIDAIGNAETRPIFAGHVEAPDTLIPVFPEGPLVSGGVVAIPDFLVAYGTDGEVFWCDQGAPFVWNSGVAGSARPVASKIVRGMPLRGSNRPAALLWSLDSLIVMQYVGPPSIFDFTVVSGAASIMSSNGVVEHNGVFYWASSAGFSMYSGVMRDVDNQFNAQWFLDNVSPMWHQKVFAFKVPRWREIWWCLPTLGSDECNHAVILNYGENVWYDTPLPVTGRSAGQFAPVLELPLLTSALPSETHQTSLWAHEVGVDERPIDRPSKAIRSRFRTHEFNVVDSQKPGQQGANRSLSVTMVEPDFNQVGDLTLRVISRPNARSVQQQRDEQVIPDMPADPKETISPVKVDGRLLSFEIESNVVGGDFHSGSPIIHVGPGTGLMT